MEEYRNGNNALKEALERRKTAELPSDFSINTMETIHAKLERKRKIQTVAIWASVILTSLLLIAGVTYIIIDYLKFNLMDYIPQLEFTSPSKEIFDISWHFILIFASLLGLDYWFRSRRRKSTQE